MDVTRFHTSYICDVNAVQHSLTPLQRALLSVNVDMVMLLLQHGMVLPCSNSSVTMLTSPDTDAL